MDYWHTTKKDRGIFKKSAITIIAIIIGFAGARFFFTVYQVSDDSMTPEFKRNKKVLVLKIFKASQGEPVLFKNPAEDNKFLLKRIAASEDDIIEINSKNIYINSKKAANNKSSSSDQRIFPVNFSSRDNMPAVKLKRNEYFLLNDNRDMSYDSREFGPINKKDIIGKVIYSFK